jgi:hypothetical protein
MIVVKVQEDTNPDKRSKPKEDEGLEIEIREK